MLTQHHLNYQEQDLQALAYGMWPFSPSEPPLPLRSQLCRKYMELAKIGFDTTPLYVQPEIYLQFMMEAQKTLYQYLEAHC